MHAEKALKKMSLSEKLWWWKYARDKRRNDYASAMDGARDEGLAEGLAEGEAKGRQKAEERYQLIVEAKDREIEELRRKLREAGVDAPHPDP
jgi:flagellar biosynthesis/type III secretory pathway protein FliH